MTRAVAEVRAELVSLKASLARLEAQVRADRAAVRPSTPDPAVGKLAARVEALAGAVGMLEVRVDDLTRGRSPKLPPPQPAPAPPQPDPKPGNWNTRTNVRHPCGIVILQVTVGSYVVCPNPGCRGRILVR